MTAASDSKNPPMCGDFVVTEKAFHIAHVLCTLEELKQKGLIKGGPVCDLEMLQAIRTVGRRHGYEPPDDRTTHSLVQYFKRGGGFDTEFSV